MEAATSTQPWKNWFAHHGPRLLLFARQQTRSEPDAEDVLQSAIVKVWKSGEGVVPELPMVFLAIRRGAIDLARREDRRAERERNAARSEWFEPPVFDDTSDVLQAAVRKLPVIYQEVVTLKIWGELTFAQIAETLEISPNTAASRYRYALAELKKNLAPKLV